MDYFKLLPDLSSGEDGTVERVLCHQLNNKALEDQWKNFIANANSLVDTTNSERLLQSTCDPFSTFVPTQSTSLFARDTFDVRQGYHSQERPFGIPFSDQNIQATQVQPQANGKENDKEHYAVEILPQGRVTTLQSLKESVIHTLKMHNVLLDSLHTVAGLLDTVVTRLNCIEERLQVQDKKNNKRFKK